MMKIFNFSELKKYTQEDWYKSMPDQGKYIADLLFKYHGYYKKKDKKFRNYVYIFKIAVFLFAMCNTIILGVSFFNDKSLQINIGLILSALITFLTALSSFFSFEQYWMRNIVVHIELNKLRDKFIFDVKNNQMDAQLLKKYLKDLNKIQNKNIKYWKNAILKIK
jgi:hypothetical protein